MAAAGAPKVNESVVRIAAGEEVAKSVLDEIRQGVAARGGARQKAVEFPGYEAVQDGIPCSRLIGPGSLKATFARHPAASCYRMREAMSYMALTDSRRAL